MMFPDSLTQTGDQAAAPEDYTPEELQRMANQPATQLFVVEDRRRSCIRCSVRKWVARMKIKIAYVIGGMAVFNAIGVAAIRYIIIAERAVRRAETAAEVRKGVMEVLREHRLISANEQQQQDAVIVTAWKPRTKETP